MDKTKIAVDIFDKLAKLYESKFMDVSLYGGSFDLFCKNITKQDAEILELACGPGNITKYLLAKRTDFKILGTDLAPNMLELAREHNPTATFQLLDCRELTSLGKKYDAVMCGFCLPYLSKEESIQLIADTAEILHPNGILYISTMEDDNRNSGFRTGSSGDQIYMNYHEAGYLKNALTENGFTILDLQRKEYPGPDGTKIIDLIIIAKK